MVLKDDAAGRVRAEGDPRSEGLRRVTGDADGASRDILAIRPRAEQPRPRVVLVLRIPGTRWTALTRGFERDQAALCGLCPAGTCCAVNDVCTIAVEGDVAKEDAAYYSIESGPARP